MMTSQLNTMNRCGAENTKNGFVHREKKRDKDPNMKVYGGSQSFKEKGIHGGRKGQSMNACFKGELYNSKDQADLKKKKISEIINKYKKSIQRLPMQLIQEERSEFMEGKNDGNHTEKSKFPSDEYFNNSEKGVSNQRKQFLHTTTNYNNADQFTEQIKENELNDSSMNSTNCVEISQKERNNILSNSLHNKYQHSTKEKSDYNSNNIHRDEYPNKKENEIQIVRKEITGKEEPIIAMNWKEKEYNPKQGSNNILINQIKKKYLGEKEKESVRDEINDIIYVEMEKNKKLNDNNLSLYEKKKIYLDYEREKQIDFKKSLILKNNGDDFHKISTEDVITVQEDIKDPFDFVKTKTFNEHIYFDEKRIKDVFKEIELMEQSIRTKNLLSNKEKPTKPEVQENVLTSEYPKKDHTKGATESVQNNGNEVKEYVESMKYNGTSEENPIPSNVVENCDTKDQIQNTKPLIMNINEKRKNIKEEPFHSHVPTEVNTVKEEPTKIKEIRNENDSCEIYKNKEKIVNKLLENDLSRNFSSTLYESRNKIIDKTKGGHSLLNKKTDPIKKMQPVEPVTVPTEMNFQTCAKSLEPQMKGANEKKQIPSRERGTSIDKTNNLINKIVPRRNLSEQIPRTKNEVGQVKKKNVSENLKIVSRSNIVDAHKKQTVENVGKRSLSKMEIDDDSDVFEQPIELIKKELYSKDYFKKKYEVMEPIERGLEEKILSSTLGHSMEMLDKNKKNPLLENFKDSLSMFDDEEEGRKGIDSHSNKVDTFQSINLNRSRKEEPVKNRFEPIDRFNRILLEKKLSKSWREWDGNKENKFEQNVQEKKKENSGKKIKETLEILKENGLESKNVTLFNENDIQDEIKKKRKMYEVKIRKDFEERIKMRRKEHNEKNEREEPPDEKQTELKEQKKKPVRKNKKDLFEEFSSDGSYYKRVYRDLYEDQCNKKMKNYFYDISDNLYLQDCSDHFFSNSQKSNSSIYLKERRPSINLDSESVSLSKIKFDDFDYNYLNRLDEIKYPRAEASSVRSAESAIEKNKSLLVLSPRKPQVVFSERESYEKGAIEKKEGKKKTQDPIINNVTRDISVMNENIVEMNGFEEKDVSESLGQSNNDHILYKLIQRKIVGKKQETKEPLLIGTKSYVMLESMDANISESKTICDNRFTMNKNINKNHHERNEMIELEKKEENEKTQNHRISSIEKAKTNLCNLENVILQKPRKKKVSVKEVETENIKTEKMEIDENNKKGKIINKKDNTSSNVDKRVNRKQIVENQKGNNELFEKKKSNQKGDLETHMENILDTNMEIIDINEKAHSIVSSSDLTLPKINILKDQENYIPLDIALNLVMDNQNLKKTMQKDTKKGTTKKKTFVQWLMDERKRRLKNNLPLDI